MRISNDLSLMISHRARDTQQAISRSLERLASGKRVNSARDDLGSFSTLVGIDSKIRGLAQANLNINSARGYIQTADAAISVQSEIIQRMRELAVQASSGILSSSDRTLINSEVSSLFAEYNRITSTAEFNGQKLLDGSLGQMELQTSASASDDFNLQISFDDLSANSVFEQVQGLGSFNLSQSIALDDLGVTTVESGDLDGDGDLDLITTGNVNTNFEVFLNDGNGQFSSAGTLDSASYTAATNFEIKDINGDGILDILTPGTGSNSFLTFLGNGDGTFGAASVVDTELAGGTVSIDFDGDGDLDVAILESTGSVEILQNDGSGSFTSINTISNAGTLFGSMKSGDVNGDGIEDLVIGDYNAASILVLIGAGDGSFTETSIVGDLGAAKVELADLDGDGTLDVLVNNIDETGYEVFLNNGSGDFTPQGSVNVGFEFGDMNFGDINSDGVLDLVISATAGVYYGLGDGAGAFGDMQTFDALTDNATAGDFNGDGVIDFAGTESGAEGLLSIITTNTTYASAVADINVNTQEGAQNLIGVLDRALDHLNESRTNLAASLSRLDIRENLNSLNMENYTAAASQIGDTDLALETANLVQLQILQQAQIAAFSQSNLNLRVVLELLEY